MLGCHTLSTLTSVTQNSLLNLMLQTAPPAFAVQPERVFLQQGPLDLAASGSFVYFPQDALLSLSQVSPVHDAVNVAVVGQHACVGPAELWGAQMQAEVMVAGHACRLDWSQVKQDDRVYGLWLWHTTVVTHGLIEQMAQTAFCVRHHNATQRLASWLLIALAQHGEPSYTCLWMRCPCPFVSQRIHGPLFWTPCKISKPLKCMARASGCWMQGVWQGLLAAVTPWSRTQLGSDSFGHFDAVHTR
jgi:hypothetical protein